MSIRPKHGVLAKEYYESIKILPTNKKKYRKHHNLHNTCTVMCSYM